MPQNNSSIPEPKAHYPYVTRRILHLIKKGLLTNVVAVDVEPEYGYAVRLAYANGQHRITYGNDLGLNNAAAGELAKDKGHTKFLLRTLGVECPAGNEFLLPWWEERIAKSQYNRGHTNLRTANQAPSYIEATMGYPVYIKPVAGSKGGDIFVVQNAAELEAVIERYDQKRIPVLMVEVPLNMPDYRIVTLDGELISAYRRIPLSVVGDGTSSIRELIIRLQHHYEKEGRDTRLDPEDERIHRQLALVDLTIDSILMAGQMQALMPISNLSAGGSSEDVTQTLHPHWVTLARLIGENFNLRLVGLDLACEDITVPDSPYSVIEVNASPGLDHYALSGDAQKELVDRLYTKVLNAFPDKQ